VLCHCTSPAGLCGGSGIVPGGNIGENVAVFEQVCENILECGYYPASNPAASKLSNRVWGDPSSWQDLPRGTRHCHNCMIFCTRVMSTSIQEACSIVMLKSVVVEPAGSFLPAGQRTGTHSLTAPCCVDVCCAGCPACQQEHCRQGHCQPHCSAAVCVHDVAAPAAALLQRQVGRC
jgi:hypothetical protein